MPRRPAKHTNSTGRSPSGGFAVEMAKPRRRGKPRTRPQTNPAADANFPYPCSKCIRRFPTKNGLAGHQNIHRRKRWSASPPRVSTGTDSAGSSTADHCQPVHRPVGAAAWLATREFAPSIDGPAVALLGWPRIQKRLMLIPKGEPVEETVAERGVPKRQWDEECGAEAKARWQEMKNWLTLKIGGGINEEAGNVSKTAGSTVPGERTANGVRDGGEVPDWLKIELKSQWYS
ncbi:hypothetical protein Nepgr_030219 [Nepenthes gracilis]|uniref:C2H2-type domain-containing protein n=1 Tax=Nepenthes gracilis TaxID=150966 RepID=A0AAD3TFT1_NEPGR|nr:hypothetical protein Nepgr_030219 [Nepenthes gracilis]